MLEIIENCKYFNINTPIDEYNNTTLHRTIRSNNKKIIRTLLLKNENGDLEINFDIKNKNNEKPFKFEDMIIDWLHQLPRNQIQMMIIDFLITNECNYNNYITREGLTWWTLVIKYNLKEVTNYLVNSVLTDIKKIDSNPFKNKNYLFDNEIKEEVDRATYNWIKQFTNSGSFKTKDNRSVEENELIKLRKELKQLRMENDILKQAALIIGRK
ncbi:hypothetical protein [Spiroplasma ixodetis]|uniref:Ankyrin repeat protein n=1 Tax=Spiroplasma ixodetis TaxID=2141 RepID=A0ABM8JLV0_9MOLU